MIVCDVAAPTYLSVVNTKIYHQAKQGAFCLVPNLHRKSCWLVIPWSPKLILAGDYHQLPPTVHNKVIRSLTSPGLND